MEEGKKHEKKLEREQQIIEMLELFPKKDSVEIINESESDQIEESMTMCFPISFWGRIDWEKVRNKNSYYGRLIEYPFYPIDRL